MVITEVRIKLCEENNERLLAFCSVTFDNDTCFARHMLLRVLWETTSERRPSSPCWLAKCKRRKPKKRKLWPKFSARAIPTPSISKRPPF